MILSLAEDLTMLARQAKSAAEDSSDDAALAEVRAQVDEIESSLAGRGIAKSKWIDQVPSGEQARARGRAEALRKGVRNLLSLQEGELAAYGRSPDPEVRGQLSAVTRDGASFADALDEAQTALLHGWVDQLWPAEEGAVLEVLSHLPSTREHARELLTLRRELLGDNALGLSEGELDDLSDRVERTAALAERLRQESVPESVLEFWQGARDEDGVRLANVAPGTLQWLFDHEAADKFVVREER